VDWARHPGQIWGSRRCCPGGDYPGSHEGPQLSRRTCGEGSHGGGKHVGALAAWGESFGHQPGCCWQGTQRVLGLSSSIATRCGSAIETQQFWISVCLEGPQTGMPPAHSSLVPRPWQQSNSSLVASGKCGCDWCCVTAQRFQRYLSSIIGVQVGKFVHRLLGLAHGAYGHITTIQLAIQAARSGRGPEA